MRQNHKYIQASARMRALAEIKFNKALRRREFIRATTAALVLLSLIIGSQFI